MTVAASISRIQRGKSARTPVPRPLSASGCLSEGKSTLNDIIFGHVEFENRLYDDFVALKSDGFPTYHLASVVDDHDMGITHVTRGKEWLSSVPRHVQLYTALGWQMPEFAHMPMILAPDKTKLSKRHGAASVMDYRDLGVLPEALMNYLALLGWSLDDRQRDIHHRRVDSLIRTRTGQQVRRGLRPRQAGLAQRSAHTALR